MNQEIQTVLDGKEGYITQGDVLEVLSSMPDGCVQCVVTSPPYWGLRDYGTEGQLGLEKTPEEYVAKTVEVFREVRRVLRADGTCWLNLGDSYATQSGSKAHCKKNTGQEAARLGGAYIDKTHKPPAGLKPKDLIGIPWRVAFALQADGWWLRSDIIWAKPNPMPESVTDRPTKGHEYIFLLTKKAKYFYDADAIREPHQYPDVNHKSTQKSEGAEQAFMGNPPTNLGRAGNNPLGRNRRSVWTIPTQPYPKAHFAVFPEKLIEPCILAGTRKKDIVLDPFMGAGTTAVVARKLNRRWLGIELNEEYVKLAKNRIFNTERPLF